MKLTPYEWQLEDLAKLRANNYTGLVAIEAGGGKSLTGALAIAESRPDVSLIIAPQSTHKTAWMPTLADNADIEARVVGNGNKAEKVALLDLALGYPGSYLITPQLITRMDLSGWSGDMLIHDESHQGATAKSKIQRQLSGYHHSDGQPLNLRFESRLALSGTPMRQQFSNMWATMRFLWPHLNKRGQIAYDNFVAWQIERMVSEDVYTNRFKFDYRTGREERIVVKSFLSEKDPGRLVREMPCVVIHKRRERCCRHHPVGFLPTEEPQVIERQVELTAKQKRSIREMEEHMMTYLQENPLVAEIPLTQKQRVRQMTLGEADARSFIVDDVEKTTIEFDPKCKSPFLDETLHILSNLPEEENVVIFMESQRFAQVATERLNAAGIPTQEYSGVRKADLSRFGQDYRVLVGVISAIGTGTAGLNHLANTEIVLEQPVSLTMKNQSEARLDRLDNKKRVQRYVLFDDLGIQEDRYGENIEKQLKINKSLRRV